MKPIGTAHFSFRWDTSICMLNLSELNFEVGKSSQKEKPFKITSS